jgi:hypothetical protein
MVSEKFSASQPVIRTATSPLDIPVVPANNAVATSSMEVPIASSFDGPSTPLPALAINASTIDPRPNPRYVSHMPPIFTEQYRREQELQEKNRVVEADRQRRAKLSKQAIIIYAWHEVHVFLFCCFQQASYYLLSFIG